MVKALVSMLCVALVASGPVAAKSEIVDLATYGAWKAYGGRADGGRKVCGVSAAGPDRWLGMKYFEGDSELTVHLASGLWSEFYDDARVKVSAQFDGRGSWTAVATSFHAPSGEGVLQFKIPSKSIEPWVDQFRKSDFLYIRFPNDHIADWKANLDGSDKILEPFVACMAAMVSTR